MPRCGSVPYRGILLFGESLFRFPAVKRHSGAVGKAEDGGCDIGDCIRQIEAYLRAQQIAGHNV